MICIDLRALLLCLVTGLAVNRPLLTGGGQFENSDRLINVSGVLRNVSGELTPQVLDGVGAEAIRSRPEWKQIKFADRLLDDDSTLNLAGRILPVVLYACPNDTIDRDENEPYKRGPSALKRDDCDVARNELLKWPARTATLLSKDGLVPRRENGRCLAGEICYGRTAYRFENTPYVEVVGQTDRPTDNAGVSDDHRAEAADFARLAGRLFPRRVRVGGPAIGGNVYRVASHPHEDDAGTAGRRKKHPKSRPPYLRINPVKNGMTTSRMPNGEWWLLHLEDQDFDVSWDMNNWYHLFGAKCLYRLPKIHLN